VKTLFRRAWVVAAVVGGLTTAYAVNLEEAVREAAVPVREMRASAALAQERTPAPAPTAPKYTTPSYEPYYWNGGIIGYNNCYNYSNNHRTDTFAQPGRATGRMYAYISADQVSAGAISDGLEPTTKDAVSPVGKTKIALVIWPGYDYYWYRRDANGMWTHKPGGTAATNLDNSGRPITDPETANRGGYTIFAGYFFTPSDAAQGQGRATIN